MVVYSDRERLEFDEYVDFLKRSDLGSQYPRQDFESRIPKVLANVDLCLTARNQDGLLVGICFGLTDWAYFLFLTDLGVDRSYVRQGIGRKLVEMAVEKAGGPANITIATISHDDALPFYGSMGIVNDENLVVRFCSDWESFVVS